MCTYYRNIVSQWSCRHGQKVHHVIQMFGYIPPDSTWHSGDRQISHIVGGHVTQRVPLYFCYRQYSCYKQNTFFRDGEVHRHALDPFPSLIRGISVTRFDFIELTLRWLEFRQKNKISAINQKFSSKIKISPEIKKSSTILISARNQIFVNK